MKNNIFLVFTLLVFLISCKDKGQKSTKSLLKINDVTFFSFATKAKMHYKDDSQNVRCTGNIRMQKDSIIWISATYLGFEVGRIKLTTDSVYILNKMKGEYIVRDFKQFGKQMNVSIDFTNIQAIFLGNQALKQQGNEKLLKGKEFHLLTKEIASFILDYKVNTQNLKIEEFIINEKESNNKTTVNYDDFKEIDGKLIPTSTEIYVEYTDTTQTEPYKGNVSFNYSKSSFSNSTLNYPFHVSSRYTKK